MSSATGKANSLLTGKRQNIPLTVLLLPKIALFAPQQNVISLCADRNLSFSPLWSNLLHSRLKDEQTNGERVKMNSAKLKSLEKMTV